MKRSAGLFAGVGVVLALSGPLAAQGPNPLAIAGRGSLVSVNAMGGEEFSVELQMRNNAAGPLAVRRAEVLFACRGGWSASAGEMIAKEGKLFGNDPTLAAKGDYQYQLQYVYSTPVTHFLLALEAGPPGRRPLDLLHQVPLRRRGFQEPAPLRAHAPAFIGLQEPVEVFELATGESWLQLVGQVINTTGRPLTLRRWHFRLKQEDGKVVLDTDVTKTFPVNESTGTLNEFFYGYSLPKGFKRGTLRIEADLDLDGRRRPLAHDVEVTRPPAFDARPPVGGTWSWSNGPGEMDFHPHYHLPEQRYAYDLVMRKDVDGKRQSFRGAPGRNESYFAWDRPIYCAEAGTVIEVVDDVPDNLGNAVNPANSPRRNSRIVVEHPNRRFSVYVHLRQGSATVKAGQQVKAGDRLGRVGNAGFSSEPHLHFATLALEPDGRLRALPIRVQGLKTPQGQPVAGVPKGRQEYRSELPE
jgi:hypothetical protein